jgi:hypothetical protein
MTTGRQLFLETTKYKAYPNISFLPAGEGQDEGERSAHHFAATVFLKNYKTTNIQHPTSNIQWR